MWWARAVTEDYAEVFMRVLTDFPKAMMLLQKALKKEYLAHQEEIERKGSTGEPYQGRFGRIFPSQCPPSDFPRRFAWFEGRGRAG